MFAFSRSFQGNNVSSSSPLNYRKVHNGVEQLQPEIFLPKPSPLGPGTLLISRDGEDDVSSIRINTARTSLDDEEYRGAEKKASIHSRATIPSDFSVRAEENNGCDMLALLKTCWSWFCGLDDDRQELADVDGAAHSGLRRTTNSQTNEGHDFMLQHQQERPLIKWILNVNLVFLILVEITLFVVFSLPVKYTFWRD